MAISAVSSTLDYTQTLTRDTPPPPVTDSATSAARPDYSSPSQSSAQLYTALVTKPAQTTSVPSSDQNDASAQAVRAAEQAMVAPPLDRAAPQAVRQSEEISAQVQALNSSSAGGISANPSGPAGIEDARIRIAAAVGEQQAKAQVNAANQAAATQASPAMGAVSGVLASDAANRAAGGSPYTAYAAPENYAAALPRGNAVNTHG